MNKWTKSILFLAIIVSTVILYKSNIDYTNAISGDADIKFSQNTEQIGSYTYGKYERSVQNITQWQYDIMHKLGIPFKTMLYLRTIQNLECGDENGFCATHSDCGPYQINNIHEVDNKWCRKEVASGLSEIEKAKNTGNYFKVLQIRNKLYESQTLWTWGRMKAQVKQYGLSDNREERMYSLAKLHNGSTHMIDYAKKSVISYDISKSYYVNLGIPQDY